MGKTIDFFGQKIPNTSDLIGQVGTLIAGQEGGKVLAASLEGVIRKIAQEEQKRGKQRLTWNSSTPPPVPDDLVVGYLNKRLPFLGPYGGRGGFYIQNGMGLTSAGTVVSEDLHEIPDTEHVWFDKAGDKHTAPSTRTTFAKALHVHRLQAAEADPLLCNVCLSYRAGSQNDAMRHLYNAHPAEFAEAIGLEVQASVETEIPATPEDPEPVSVEEGQFVCDCGKRFPTVAGIRLHQAKSKIHRQAG